MLKATFCVIGDLAFSVWKAFSPTIIDCNVEYSFVHSLSIIFYIAYFLTFDFLFSGHPGIQ